MQIYGLNELRKMYLDYFESKDHLVLKSFSLVPNNDKSLLLVNAGMAPLKPYFTGQEIPPKNRIATCQKCIRTGDIENVGKTARHLTFFEMLGNFSFGDYFKKEAIEWSWEFLTKYVGLDESRLYASIYLNDEEACEIWNKVIALPKEKIFRFDEDNFWEHGAGPCGPCSEIFYDRGEKYGCGDENCTVGCECDRYMEVWNNVFTQFNSDGQGNYEELLNKNIDTGMGLERLAAVVQDAETIFDVDTIKAIRDRVCEIAKVEYRKDDKTDVSIRLITDHIRSVTFMTSDGIIPSNEGRGYVLRRLLRRAARHGRLLGIKGKFLSNLALAVISESKDGYPELEEKKDYILKLITVEEDKFDKTIDQGLTILSDMINELIKDNKKILNGEDAFKLYDTYGFPIDLTKEILEEKGYSLNEDAFNKSMDIQRETARGARTETNYMGSDITIYQKIDPNITSEFVGYNKLACESDIIVITSEDEIVEELVAGQIGTIIVDETPFYPTMGGQIADEGLIKIGNSIFRVDDTIKLQGGKIGHLGTVVQGIFKLKDRVKLEVNNQKRNNIAKNHSATHLLHKALKVVLGNHVEQAGSLVSEDKLRFDFTHFEALTLAEIEEVEKLINKEIQEDYPVVTDVMNVEEAKKSGAMALFGEKYDNDVRVVTMGDYSKELCGGTHVDSIGKIMVFKIISESGIAAGVRRIEALTGNNVIKYYKTIENELNHAAKAAKSEPAQLVSRIEGYIDEIKSLNNENQKLKNKLAKDSLGDLLNSTVKIKEISLLAAEIPEMEMNDLRNLGDQIKDKFGEGVIVLVSSFGNNKVSIVSMVTDEAMKQGAHAGNLIKALASFVGGGGGGRPNMAQAGGKNPKGIKELLVNVPIILEQQIK
ncbi:MAG TPA: alanine--tRNA ligase [Clostridiales bacterium]|nr:alanine--tRNA ligase [Clostridiales bacterium]